MIEVRKERLTMEKVSFFIDKKSNQPIYRQIVDQVTQMVTDGLLSPGDQLPTGSELFATYGIAKGTVRCAYDCLRKNGIISVVQGKGSFIRGKESVTKTIDTIDYYLDELSPLISLDELELLVQQKIQGRIKRQQTIRISVLEGCQEICSDITLASSSFQDTSISQNSIQGLFSDPSNFYGYDLIVSSESNITSISKEPFPQDIKDRLVPISINFDFETLKQLATLPVNASIGILCQTKRYFEMNRWELAALGRTLTLHDYFLMGNSYQGLEDYLINKNVLLVAQTVQPFTSSEHLQILELFKSRGGRIIPLKYVPDVGSMLHLEEHICHLRVSYSRILH